MKNKNQLLNLCLVLVCLCLTSHVVSAQNIALYKPTLTSSNYSSAYDGSKAVDGNTGTKWTTSSSAYAPHWIRIDLQQQYNVTRVKILHAATGGEPYYFNTKRYSVQLSLDGSNWTTVATYTNTAQHHTTHHDPPASQQRARYVRYYIHEANFVDQYARIPEIEVNGTPAGSGTPTSLNVSKPGCSSSAYTANFTWSGSGSGWWIDVSENSGFPADTRTFHKRIDNVSSTSSSGLCVWYDNCSQTLSLQPGKTYYWRIWNGSTHTNGPSFTVPGCSGGGNQTIYGIHFWASGAGSLMNGKKGWTLEVINAVHNDPNALNGLISAINSEGAYQPIVRINWNYGNTIPDPSLHQEFANRCRNIVSNLYNNYGVKYFHIGNEMNQDYEYAPDGDGKGVPADEYANCFKTVYSTVKAAVPGAQILVGPVANWNAVGQYTWTGAHVYYDQYFDRIVNQIGGQCDGYAIHTYGMHGSDNRDWYTTADRPFALQVAHRAQNSWGFGSYKVMMKVLAKYSYARTKPVFITETNTYHGLTGPEVVGGDAPAFSYPSGWMQQSFGEINNWNTNATGENTYGQKINALCWFVYEDDGMWKYFALANNHGSLPTARSDFQNAVNYNYGSSVSRISQEDELAAEIKDIDEALEEALIDGFSIYPNPADHVLHIRLRDQSENARILIYSMAGEEIYSKAYQGDLLTMSTSALEPGTYLVKVITADEVKVRKVQIR
ncbi:hypothetical protein GCM10009122_37820 [Fulvivirga kasyanovii]|uniref:T9SS type A sorting domain-containing protein n=1 Tax=Fulvivirga kasyanovii TaxID=396812 RepID=A0ABW9RNF0_9BACT|nr:discoidin domain-containing protein [Fulvivirga kasyanovii]MTI25516.1 T9SS type A sorting domain-containing protein [Fulvivirga kasyanovii]